METRIYTVKSNAKRDALKAIASGAAPGTCFDIEAVEGGYRVVWPNGKPEAGAEPAEPAEQQQLFKARSTAAHHAKTLIRQKKAPARGFTIEKTDAGLWRVLWGDQSTPARTNTKFAGVLAMLQRPDGATVAEIMKVTGWLPHTTRARISTGCRQFGLGVSTEKVDGRGRVYRAA